MPRQVVPDLAVKALLLAAALAATNHGSHLHDARYCEILVLRGAPPSATVTVWNTIGLNKCPAKWWRGFDSAALARELGATFVLLNGPRHFLMDSATASTGGTRSFHGMRMRKVATIPIKSAGELVQTPYTDRTIDRTNTWKWNRGRTVFELVAPGGDVYVMQSYAQIKDPKLTLARLTSLGRRLKLPLGWHYRARKLRKPLVLRARGHATVLQDDLQDTYQLARVVAHGKRARHALDLTGKTHSVSPTTPGTVEDHGTVAGSPFGPGRIVLVGNLGGGRLNATFRLTFPRGSILGTTSMPFTISGNEIDFNGESRFTGGTGIYRGIKSGPLATHDHNTLDGQNGQLSVAGTATYRGSDVPSRQEAVQAGRDAYIYGFPLIDFLRIRRDNTSVHAPDERGNAPLNFFSHAPSFAEPKDRTVVAPNVDTLYSIAQLDLGKGPIVLSHPSMGRRYFVFELVDPYTNVVGYIGTRTTGRKAGRFAITWTGRRNARPPRGVHVLRSRYRRLWVIGRTLATDTPADLKSARKLQHKYTLTPLSRLGHPPKPPSGKPGKPVKAKDPTDLAFFDALGDALRQNPPPARDKPLLRRLKRFGIGPGLHPSRSGLPKAVLDGLRKGYAAESSELANTTRFQIFSQAIASGGWYTPLSKIGRFGTDYLFRAQIALVGIGANTPEEAIYPGALADANGKLLDATKRYRMTFAPGQAPPAGAFWSLTMYDLAGFLVPNPAGRYAIGPFHPPLVKRADGSIVVALQRDKPAEAGVNWLPTPASGNFRLNLRIYEPARSALTGKWKPPPVEPVP